MVPGAKLREALEPLAVVLGSYDIYILPVGSWRNRDVLDSFAREAARIPGHGILVLIPDYYDPEANIQVLDPSPAATEAIRNRGAWPGAIFMLRSGEANFWPIDEAHHRVIQLADIMHNDRRGQRLIRQVVTAPAQHAADRPLRRLLHLSDLHLGTRRAENTQTYVQAALLDHFAAADQIVITGDLFDQPRRRHAQQYRNFADQLRLLSGKVPIVVPGNHDQRIFGNAIFGIGRRLRPLTDLRRQRHSDPKLRLLSGKFPIVVPGKHDQRIFGNAIFGIGRRLRQLTDLRWREIVVDSEAQIAFFCFDSSRTGDLARGCVDQDQLLRMGTEYAVSNTNHALDNYLKVALVHHHPYP